MLAPGCASFAQASPRFDRLHEVINPSSEQSASEQKWEVFARFLRPPSFRVDCAVISGVADALECSGMRPRKRSVWRLVLAAAIIHDVTAYSAGIQRFCPRHHFRSRQPVVATPMMLAKQEEVEAKDKESKKPYKKAKAVKHEKKQAVPEPAASADELIASAAKQPEPVTESTSSDGVDLQTLQPRKPV